MIAMLGFPEGDLGQGGDEEAAGGRLGPRAAYATRGALPLSLDLPLSLSRALSLDMYMK